MNQIQAFIERYDELNRHASAVAVQDMWVLAVAEFGVSPDEVYDPEDAADAVELQADADWFRAVGRFRS